MSEEVTLDIVMARRFDLVEQIALIQGRHKNELEPLAEEMRLCEMFIKDEMNKSGMQQCKTSAGMAYFTTKDSVTMDNWDSFIATVEETHAWHLLNHAANKTAVKEYIEQNNAPPPGVRYESFKDLAWRRGKR